MVLEASAAAVNYNGTGIGAMGEPCRWFAGRTVALLNASVSSVELSHRSKIFGEINNEAIAYVRKLL